MTGAEWSNEVDRVVLKISRELPREAQQQWSTLPVPSERMIDHVGHYPSQMCKHATRSLAHRVHLVWRSAVNSWPIGLSAYAMGIPKPVRESHGVMGRHITADRWGLICGQSIEMKTATTGYRRTHFGVERKLKRYVVISRWVEGMEEYL